VGQVRLLLLTFACVNIDSATTRTMLEQLRLLAQWPLRVRSQPQALAQQLWLGLLRPALMLDR
jgi:hypothetical protein